MFRWITTPFFWLLVRSYVYLHRVYEQGEMMRVRQNIAWQRQDEAERKRAAIPAVAETVVSGFAVE